MSASKLRVATYDLDLARGCAISDGLALASLVKGISGNQGRAEAQKELLKKPGRCRYTLCTDAAGLKTTICWGSNGLSTGMKNTTSPKSSTQVYIGTMLVGRYKNLSYYHLDNICQLAEWFYINR